MNPPTYCRFVRFRTILLGSALLAALNGAFAAFTMTETVPPGLGMVFSGASGRQFILNTDETVSGASAIDYISGAVSGQLTLVKTQGPADVNIVAENITTLGGLTVNAVPCRFHNDPQTTCDGAGINVRINQTRILYVGVNITTSQPHNSGDTASASYDINVIFL
jgi:hypothetical protein